MSLIHQIPEIKALNGVTSVVRIPDEIDVPLTPRVRKLIDTPEFRRLGRITQLGLVSLVYPAQDLAQQPVQCPPRREYPDGLLNHDR